MSKNQRDNLRNPQKNEFLRVEFMINVNHYLDAFLTGVIIQQQQQYFLQ